jgi:hypothetical protein
VRPRNPERQLAALAIRSISFLIGAGTPAVAAASSATQVSPGSPAAGRGWTRQNTGSSVSRKWVKACLTGASGCRRLATSPRRARTAAASPSGGTSSPLHSPPGGAALKQQALAVADQHEGGAALGQLCPRARRRQFTLASFQPRPARCPQRAAATARPAARAHGGAKIHQALRIGFAIAFREQPLGQRPQFAVHCRLGGISGNSEAPAQDALDIAVENGGATPEGEDGDRRRRRPADAGQGAQRGGGLREFSGVDRDDLPRAAMQIARPGVVAESGPVLADDLGRRFRKLLQRRKARQEALEVRDDGGDPGLLQHDLGEPDPVGVAAVLPRQVVAPGGLLPGDQAVGELGSGGQFSLDARMRSTDNKAFFDWHTR